MQQFGRRVGRFFLLVSCLCMAFAAHGAATEQKSEEDVNKEFNSLPWQTGPFKGEVGSKATIAVPEKAKFLGQGKTDKFFELTGNLPHPGATVIVGSDWFAVFGFADSGYIKDDEKIDPDALLKSMQEGEEEANAERAKRGLQKLHNLGWAVPPHYDAQTKHLEWGETPGGGRTGL